MNSGATVPGPGIEQSSLCALTVIVDANPQDPDLLSSVRAIEATVSGLDAQVIVTCQAPWDDAPEGVEVVVYPSAGQGDRYDAASKEAKGALLAFVSSRVTVSPSWGKEVLRLFDDPTLVVAGGAIVPEGRRRSERLGALIMTQYLRGTPSAHNARPVPSRPVREVGSSNLIIRTSAFRAVGGFQAPPGGNGEASRLCYKVRHLLGGRIMSEPTLALSAPAPGFPGPLFRNIAIFGRSRGGLARRLPEAAPLLPYALPSIVSALFCVGVVLLAFGSADARRIVLLLALALLASFLLVQSLRARRGPDALGDRLLAGAVLPAVVFVYGVAFVRGYLGRSAEVVTPSRGQNRPLRVLIFNWRDVTHPRGGGAEAYMQQIGRRWAEEGMDVGWVTQRHAGSPRVEVIDRIRIHRVGGRVTQYPFAAFAYLTRLRKRYDVVVDCANGVPFFTPLYSRLPRVLLVHHVHQETFRAQLPPPFRWLALWLEGWLMPRLYRHTRVVAVSEGTRTDLVGLGFDPEQIVIVTSGVVIPEQVVRNPSPQPSILCMGRLMPMKAVDVLIRSVPTLLARFPELRVDIVGQGPDRPRLERLAWSTGLAGTIRFHGWVTAAVRDEICGAAWLAVCPSRFEGWGLVCMEASALSLPVVASDAPGLRESVRDGETGILFSCGDEQALADAVASLLVHRELRERMGEAGRQWAARHTWEGSASTFAAVLRAQVGSRLEDSESAQLASFAPWA
jgi:glycosyltransferase involved in cell wall biosynthesis